LSPPGVEPQLTLRAVVTGMVLGSVLSLCNIYAGLKIGWLFNMSVTAVLLSFGFWGALHRSFGTPRWGMLENNISQTTTSAAASIASAGLVAPIPALTILTGRQLSWPALSVWAFLVSALGVVVAIGLRHQMLVVDRLPFPAGIATAETLRQIYARGREATRRVFVLLGGGAAAAALKVTQEWLRLAPVALPGRIATSPTDALGAGGFAAITMKNLTFALDPSLLMVGFGAIIGLRACVSLLAGAVLAWGVIGPRILTLGWATPDPSAPDGAWFGTMVAWLLWPGVALMVTSSLTSVAFSWRSFVAMVRPRRGAGIEASASRDGRPTGRARAILFGGIAGLVIAAVIGQNVLFDIGIGTGALAVALTCVLAIVAARVSGETGITPIGAMGQVTQFVFGVVAPGQAASNLMAANVTGGAASQCADLLHDLKTGEILGSSPRAQTRGQLFGVLIGAPVGAAAYLALVPDPKSQLLTDEWPAPAVATWKAVAELFTKGLSAMPPAAMTAMLVGGAAGVVLAVLERVLPKAAQRFVPSAASLGLAFVIPAYNSMSMFAGALAAAIAARFAPRWSERFVVVLAAGLVAGESLAGVAYASVRMLFGLG
jgi:putative OPT family oligopeptide transporter